MSGPALQVDDTTMSIHRRSALVLQSSGGGNDDDTDRPGMPLLHDPDDTYPSSNHENDLSYLSWVHFLVCRTVSSVSRMTRSQLCIGLAVLILSSTVTSLITYAIRGTVNVWLVLCVDAVVMVCLLRDGHTLSIPSALVLFALFLFLAAPILSESSILLLAALIVLPLQWLIHRHRQDVTLEKFKIPPLARVKALDVHPTESSLLGLAYYTGHVVLWDVANNTSYGMELSPQQPLRSLRFLKHPKALRDRRCFVTGGDDGRLTLVDGGSSSSSPPFSMNILASVLAHSDFVRCVDVHPTQSIVLSCSDDRAIKVWTLVDTTLVERTNDEGVLQPSECWRFVLCQVLEGHHDFVMQVRFHPTFESSFVSTSLDHSMIRWDWNVTSCHDHQKDDVLERGEASWFPVGTFRGHEQGINCVEFVSDPTNAALPRLLLSGSDDATIKVWNYENQELIHSIQNAHDHNITSICVSRADGMSMIVSTCEDGLCKIWDTQTWSLDTILNLNQGRAWTGVTMANSNQHQLAIGYDQGCVVLNVFANITGNAETTPEADLELNSQSVTKASALVLSRVDVRSSPLSLDEGDAAELQTLSPADSSIQMDRDITTPLAVHRTRHDFLESSVGAVWYVHLLANDTSSSGA